MVKCLNSMERSCFVEEYIGNPFSKDFSPDMREILVQNLCKETYAGSLIILLIEYFDELHSTARKMGQEGQDIVVALGANNEEAAEVFGVIWKNCIQGLYPIEIQMLKETCKDRFDNWI